MLVNLWQETLDYLRRSFPTGTKRRKSRGRSVASVNVVEALESRVLPTAVLSINGTLAAAATTSASTVTYTVRFDVDVTGVDASDFQLTTTGSVVATTPVVVTPVTASDYTVTVNGVHGSGDLRLDLIDDDSIEATGDPLGGTGVNNGSFQGQTYHVLQVNPVVKTIDRLSPTGPNTSENSVTFSVTFSSDVVGVDANDFKLAFTGTANATIPVQVSGTGDTYTVTVTGITGNGTLGLDLVDDNSIRDLVGNPLVSTVFATSFLAQQSLTSGTPPTSLTLADVNGDGRFDLITVNESGNSVQVALGNATGTFQAAQSFTTGNGPTAIAVKDVNGDGAADLLTANKLSDTVSVLLGNGNGTFQAPLQVATGQNPTALAVEDLNRDGKPDLVVTNELDNNVGVYRGVGDGTFAAPQFLATGTQPSSVALQDINKDGRIDIVVANQGSNNVSILRGAGPLAFQPQITFPMGTGPASVAIADFDGDGSLDLVTANKGDNDVTILAGFGDGTFQPPNTFATGLGPTSVAIGDVNGDGEFDLIVANQSDNSVSVLSGNGDGTFQTQQTFATGTGPNMVALADIDRDGRVDLATANATAGSVSILTNGGVGDFTGRAYVLTNTPPSITSAATATFQENTSTAVVVLDVNATDSDLPAQTLKFSIAGTDAPLFDIDPATGEITFLVSPDFEAPADGNVDNDYEITVAVDDGSGGIATQAITITVLPQQDNVPVFTSAASATIDENTPLSTVILKVTATDADQPAQALTYRLVGIDAGLFSIDGSTGEIRFLSNPDFEVPGDADSDNDYLITAEANDGAGGVTTQAITVKVLGINDNTPNLDSSTSATVPENTAAGNVILDLNATDADRPIQTLTYSITGGDASLFSINAATGQIRFLASPNFEAPADTGSNNIYNFSAVVTDDGSPPRSTTRPITITVSNVDEPPQAQDDTLTTVEDAAQTGALHATDVDSTTLIYQLAGGPLHGSVVIDNPATGAYTYTPNPGYIGPDSFDFTANDGTTVSNIATVTISVTTVNDAPSFIPGADETPLEDSSSTGVSGEHVVAGWATAISAGPPDEAGQLLAFQLSNNNNGLFSTQPAIAPNGTLSYTLAPNAFGSATVTVELQDNGGTANGGLDTSTSATFTITVTGVNDAPSFTAGGDITVLEDSGNFSAAWATSISAGPNEIGQSVAFTVSDNNHSLFAVLPAIAPNGTLTFRPAPDANGTATVTVSLKDNGGTASGGSDTSGSVTFVITVGAVDDPPVAQDGTLTATEDTAQDGFVDANDVDSPVLTFSVVSNPTHGTVVINDPVLGSYTYTPAADYNGPDSFTFKANDGTQDSNVATIIIVVGALNDAPVATDGNLTVIEDTPRTGTLSATDIDSAILNFSVVGGPLHGSVVIDDPLTGAYTYTPAQDYNGPDSFTFVANDGSLDSNTATVTINITAVDDQPVAIDSILNPVEDTPKSGSLGGTDIDSATLTFRVISGPSHGSVALIDANAGTYLYTPAADYNGPDSFKFVANDGNQDSNTGTVTINVSSLNDAPVASDDNLTVVENISKSGKLVATDIDSVSLTFRVISGPSHGSVVINDASTGQYTYSPAPNYNGSDTFKFAANDGAIDSNTGTISITVTPANSVPVGNDATLSVPENSIPGTVVGVVTATDPDVGDTLTFALIGGNTGGTFAVDPVSGAITVVNNTLLDYENPVTFVLAIRVTDAAGATGTANVTINITNVDEPLIVTLPDPAPTYHRGNAPVVIDPGAYASDPDTEVSTYYGGTLRVSIETTDSHAADDRLWVQTQGNGPSRISVLFGNVVYESSLVIIGQIVSGEDGGPLVINLTSFATPTAVYTMMKAITFENTSSNVQAGSRSITFDLSDGPGNEHDTETKLVQVTPVSAPPVLTLPSGPLIYLNGSSATALDGAATVSDADSPDFLGGRLTVSIAQGASRKDRLSIVGVDGISVQGRDVLFQGHKIGRLTRGKTTLTVDFNTAQATSAAAQALVRSIAFTSLAGNTSLADRIVNFTLTDGDGGSQTATKTVHLS